MDRAIWERLHLVPFDLSFVDNPQEDFQRKRDPDLPEKLKIEASGILAWLVRGCLEWQAGGLQPPSKVLETTAQYKADEDIVGQFLNDCTLKDPNEIVRAGVLYNTYKSWCERCGYRYLTTTKFGGQIKERFEKGSNSQGNFYKGLCLTSDLQGVDLAQEDGWADYV
jgi:putative DNA primase/helicase